MLNKLNPFSYMVNEVCGPWQWDGSCNSAIISRIVRINKLRNSLRKKFPDSVFKIETSLKSKGCVVHFGN